MIRHSDVVRNYIRDNVLTTYNPAPSWGENKGAFQIDEPIIYCRQDGRPGSGITRNVSVDVYLFTKLNATLQNMSDTYNDAIESLEYLTRNPRIDEYCIIGNISDVQGEYYTGQNRIYYRLSIPCYTLIV